jgi:hypothetical protein
MSGLVKYDAMLLAIDACYRVDEVVEIRSQAAALKEYMRQAGNTEAERKAAEIRIRAERKAGLLTREMEKHPGTRTDSQPPTRAVGGSTTKQELLESAGISPRQARDWEKLAAAPQEAFDRAMAEADMPTTKGIVAAVTPPKTAPISKRARVLWSWLKAFEAEGYLASDPADVLRSMDSEMLDYVHRQAPRMAAWFACVGKGIKDADAD